MGIVGGSRHASSESSQRRQTGALRPHIPMSSLPVNGNSTRNVNVVLTERGCEASSVLPCASSWHVQQWICSIDRFPVMPHNPVDRVLVNGCSKRVASDVVCVA